LSTMATSSGRRSNLTAHTVTQYPFSQKLDENVFSQELRFELSQRWARSRSAARTSTSAEGWTPYFIFHDPDLFGWTISYLTPVIPPRAEWQHDANSRVYHLGTTGFVRAVSRRADATCGALGGGRYDRLDLDNTRDGGDTLATISTPSARS
jgi:hypothetical protein